MRCQRILISQYKIPKKFIISDHEFLLHVKMSPLYLVKCRTRSSYWSYIVSQNWCFWRYPVVVLHSNFKFRQVTSHEVQRWPSSALTYTSCLFLILIMSISHHTTFALAFSPCLNKCCQNSFASWIELVWYAHSYIRPQVRQSIRLAQYCCRGQTSDLMNWGALHCIMSMGVDPQKKSRGDTSHLSFPLPSIGSRPP